MKSIILLLTTNLIFSFSSNLECGDGQVYSNKKQTEFDKRFDIYSKIDGVPKYKGGEKKLDKLIYSKLKLSEDAKKTIFKLNYQFTVTCEGKIKDIKELGDTKLKGWTNIIEIIQNTEGNWKPAKKDGKNVDCIYFSRLSIKGYQY